MHGQKFCEYVACIVVVDTVRGYQVAVDDVGFPQVDDEVLRN